MRRSLALLLLIILTSMLSTGLSRATSETQNQESPLLQWYVSMAQNDLNNAKYWIQQYDSILNDTTKLKVYDDMVTSFDQIKQAEAQYDPSQYNFSLQSGRLAMFLATRSTYRIALAAAFAHILSAEQEINKTPSYVTPSPEANASLTQAELAYYSYYYSGYLGYQYPIGSYWFFDAPDVNVTVREMRAAVEALLFGPNNNSPSVVTMADTALKSAELWNETQEPKARQIWLENRTVQQEKIDSVKNSFIYSAIPSALILTVILVIVTLRFSSLVYAWAKRTIRLPKNWKGEFDKKEVAILLSPCVTLTYASSQLAYVMTQVSTVAYPNGSVIWGAALFGAFLGILALISVVWNLFRPRRSTAFGSVILVLCAIAFYLIIASIVFSVVFAS